MGAVAQSYSGATISAMIRWLWMRVLRAVLILMANFTENQQPTFVGRRQESASFTLETEVSTKGDVEAGLVKSSDQRRSFDLFVSRKQGVALRCKLKSIDDVVKSVPRLRKGSVNLRIRSNGEMYFFALFARWTEVPRVGLPLNCSLMSTEVASRILLVSRSRHASARQGKGVDMQTSRDFHYVEK